MARPTPKNRRKPIEPAESVYSWRVWDISQRSPKKNELPLKSSIKLSQSLISDLAPLARISIVALLRKEKNSGTQSRKQRPQSLGYLVQPTQPLITCAPCLDINYTVMSGHNVWFLPKGRFTRYDFVAYDKLTTGLRHELFRVNQTYNLLTTVVYVKKNVVGF